MERYKVERKIGEGCFGQVYAARCVASGSLVALKKIALSSPDEEGIPFPVARELLTLRLVHGHPHVIRLVDVFAHGFSVVLVMEWCETDLARVLLSHSAARPVGVALVRRWMKMLLSAMAHCHAHGVLHRDVKPGNCFLASDGSLRLGDFGLSRVSEARSDLSMTHEVATRSYRAPELLLGATHYGGEVDVWSAGCVLAELLRGFGGAVFPGEGDIDQLSMIFTMLGTPTEASWPLVNLLPDWGKIQFASRPPKNWRSLLPHAPPTGLDLLARILVLDPSRRPTAQEALSHPFFLEGQLLV